MWKMGFQGVALLFVAVLGITVAVYNYYSSSNASYSYGNNRSNSNTYTPPPPPPESRKNDNAKKREKKKFQGVNVDLGKDQCAICQDILQGVSLVLGCRHIFHEACIDKWFMENNTCPICRTPQAL